MTIEIDEARALELLEQAVAERGENYMYQSEFGEGICQYQVDGKPACLVGVALHKAGVPERALRILDSGVFSGEDGTVFEPGATGITDLAKDFVSWDESIQQPPPLSLFGIVLTQKALKVFDIAQMAQDGGASWGSALAEAQKELV